MSLFLSKLLAGQTVKCLSCLSSQKAITHGRIYFHSTNVTNRLKCPKSDFINKTRLALPSDYENVLDFMVNSYYKHDPLLTNMGLNTLALPAPMYQIMLSDIKQGMTIIMEDRDNCIIGAIVNAVIYPWTPAHLDQFAKCNSCPPFRDAIEFLAYMMWKPNLWERYCVLRIFEVSALAVDPEFRGLGIAKRLLVESWHLARDCGYRLYRLDCTSRFTAKIADSIGWERVATIPYCRYVKNGNLVFKNIKKPHTEVQIFVDCLRYCKNSCLPYKRKCNVTVEPKIDKPKK